MAGALVPVANVWQFFTNAGAILAGGKLYTYAAGTSTPLTTYTTKALSVQNANPIVLDSYGRLPNGVFVEAGTSCKLILHDSAGNQLGPTFDNLDAVGGSGAAGSGAVFWGATAGGTPNAITLNPSGYAANSAGNTIYFIAASDNTGAVTLNVASLGAVNIQKQGTTALVAGDIQANAVICVVHDGTKFQLESTSDILAQLIRAEATGSLAAGTVASQLTELDTEKVAKAGDTITGPLVMSGAAINMAQGTALSDSGTPDLGAVAGNYVEANAGTTTWTALGTVQAGTTRIVKFGTARQITHNATSLILPSAANITTVSGDTAEFVSLGSGNWRCVWYIRGDGTTVLGAATQSDQETATNATKFVTPGRQQFHPSAIKAWVVFNEAVDGVIQVVASYNVDGVADNGSNNYRVTFTTDFSGTSYGVLGSGREVGGDIKAVCGKGSATAGYCDVEIAGAGRPEYCTVAFIGDQ